MRHPRGLQHGDEPSDTGQSVREPERAEYPWGDDVAELSAYDTEVEQLFGVIDA
jgi:hypothetical protein